MRQLRAVDRALEPHPPLHLWDGGVPAHLHLHQQGLEGRGERGRGRGGGPAAPGLRQTFVPMGRFSAPSPPLPPQDYLFRLVPGFVESGKGKCSYDPKEENVALLLGTTVTAPQFETCRRLWCQSLPVCSRRTPVRRRPHRLHEHGRGSVQDHGRPDGHQDGAVRLPLAQR